MKVEIHYYGNVIILQYNNCELYRLNGERHLTSAEMIQMENWFFKTISGMNPLAVRDPERLRYELLEKIVRKAYWKNVANAKNFASYLLREYTGRFSSLPEVQIKVNMESSEANKLAEELKELKDV